MSSRPRTIRVNLHLSADGQCAIGVLEQEWNGARRLDRRLAAARPVRIQRVLPPRGVPADVWLALQALQARVDDLAREAAGQPR